MKLKAQTKDLTAAVARASGPLTTRHTMPILGAARLNAIEGRVVVETTDLEQSAACSAPAEVKTEGVAAIPAKRLLEVLRATRQDEVEIEVAAGTATIKSGRGRVKLLGFDPADFPSIPVAESDPIEVDIYRLRNAIDRTLFAASTDDTRAHLCTLLLEESGGFLRLVSTDGHRLSVTETEIEAPAGLRALAPASWVRNFRRALEWATTPAALRVDRARIEITLGDYRSATRLVDAEFPAWEAVLPAKPGPEVAVLADDLADAVKRISVVASQANHGVRLTLGETVRIAASSVEAGEAVDEVDIVRGKVKRETEVGVSIRYLGELLRATAGETVLLRVSTPEQPILVQVDGADHWRHALMPMRV